MQLEIQASTAPVLDIGHWTVSRSFELTWSITFSVDLAKKQVSSSQGWTCTVSPKKFLMFGIKKSTRKQNNHKNNDNNRSWDILIYILSSHSWVSILVFIYPSNVLKMYYNNNNNNLSINFGLYIWKIGRMY